jgi:hypothetical protein
MSQRSIDELPQGTPKVDSLVAFADPATGIAYKIDIKEFLKTGIDEGGSFRAPVFMNTPVQKPEDLPKAGLAGELRIVLSTKSIYGWDEITQSWINGGNIQGPAGETLKISASVDFADHLPARPAVLTTVLVTGTKELYIYDPGNPQASAGPAAPAVPEVPGTNPGDPPLHPAVPAQPPAGWVALGRIDGPKGDIGPKGDPGLDKGTVEGQILRWSVGLDKWVGGAAPVVTPNGNADGDTLRWNQALNKYESVPLPNKLSGLADVDDNAGNLGQSCVLVWDPTSAIYVDSRSIEIDDITFDASGPATLMEGIAAVSDSGLDPTKDTWVPSCAAVEQYIRNDVNLENLADCGGLAVSAAGQVPVWNDTAGAWEPVDLKLLSLADVSLTSVTDKQVLQYDSASSKWKNAAPVPDTLDKLSDVTLTGLADKQILQYDNATSQWKNLIPDYLNPTNGYTKTEIDAKFDTLVLGLEHGQAVQSIQNDPPTTPTPYEFFIVGTVPTGAWVGHANNVAWWNGTAWQFQMAQAKESRLVEDQQATYTWNGTSAWVKVATATTAAVAAGDLWQVGSIQQSLLTEAQWATALGADATRWVLADGRDVSGSRWATLTGQTRVPDLRGAFLRAAGQNNNAQPNWNGGTVGAFHNDTTRLPRTAFTGVTNTTGSHVHGNGAGGQIKSDGAPNWLSGREIANTAPAGDHSHTVTINGGGDVETAPVHYGVNTFIKIN